MQDGARLGARHARQAGHSRALLRRAEHRQVRRWGAAGVENPGRVALRAVEQEGSRARASSSSCLLAPRRKYAVDASPYEGVEMLWNHQNVWVCMQMPLPHSDSRAHPKDISLELGDPSKW